METWTIWLLVGLGILLVITLGLLSRFLRGKQRAVANEMTLKFSNENMLSIASNANCFGIESKGMSQVRGNGCWLLTDSAIHFQMFLPKREISIPLNRVTGVEFARSFLGKGVVGVKLLVIAYKDSQGRSDRVAFALSDAENRAKMIRQRAGNSRI